mmetsp:Transcript_16263/g.48852  ORF Transcript_16263/g.48852 Transcript_16263/m.48852 type:complete len:252 (-) Transcript_16263:254-1009(-)
MRSTPLVTNSTRFWKKNSISRSCGFNNSLSCSRKPNRRRSGWRFDYTDGTGVIQSNCKNCSRVIQNGLWDQAVWRNGCGHLGSGCELDIFRQQSLSARRTKILGPHHTSCIVPDDERITDVVVRRSELAIACLQPLGVGQELGDVPMDHVLDAVFACFAQTKERTCLSGMHFENSLLAEQALTLPHDQCVHSHQLNNGIGAETHVKQLQVLFDGHHTNVQFARQRFQQSPRGKAHLLIDVHIGIDRALYNS